MAARVARVDVRLYQFAPPDKESVDGDATPFGLDQNSKIGL